MNLSGLFGCWLYLTIYMYFKYSNTEFFVFKYKIQNTFQIQLKYKILAKYLKYVFEILVFQILYNSAHFHTGVLGFG